MRSASFYFCWDLYFLSTFLFQVSIFSFRSKIRFSLHFSIFSSPFCLKQLFLHYPSLHSRFYRNFDFLFTFRLKSLQHFLLTFLVKTFTVLSLHLSIEVSTVHSIHFSIEISTVCSIFCILFHFSIEITTVSFPLNCLFSLCFLQLFCANRYEWREATCYAQNSWLPFGRSRTPHMREYRICKNHTPSHSDLHSIPRLPHKVSLNLALDLVNSWFNCLVRTD